MQTLRMFLVGVIALAVCGCGGGSSSAPSSSSTNTSGSSAGKGSNGSTNTSGSGSSTSTSTGAWQALPNPYGAGSTQRGQVIAVAPNGDIYVGGSAGVAYSSDKGQTWTPVGSGLPNAVATALSFNALGEPIIGLGVSPTVGVFRYTGGAWHQASGIQASKQFSGFALDKTGAIIAVTAWGGDVYRSTDNGDTYTLTASNIGVSFNGAGGALWTVNASPCGDLYAGGELPGGVYRSTDNGATWQTFGLDSNHGYSGNILAIGYDRQGELLVGRPGNGRADDLQRYSSGACSAGGTWSASSSGLPPYINVLDIATSSTGQIFACLDVANPSSANLNIYRSTDNGQTWQTVGSGLGGSPVLKLAADSAGNVYGLATSETGPFGIFRITPGP